MAFAGSIRLNALDLTADTSEAVFLRHGGVRVQGHAHSWPFGLPTIMSALLSSGAGIVSGNVQARTGWHSWKLTS